MNAGDHFAGYTIKGKCGEGAFGTVYLVEDMLGQTMALKIFHSINIGERELESLRRYMQLPPSPSLLKIIHSGMEDNCLFYVMQAADNAGTPDNYIPDTLEYRMRQLKQLPLEQALNYCNQLLDATELLHKAGMVHRDIKPSNIVFVNGELKLADLGLLANYSQTLSIAGSLGFIPPEILDGTPTKNTTADIYAIGKTLYCMVTGNTPNQFPAMPANLPFKTLCSVCKPLSSFCAKDATLRTGSCAEGRELLARAQMNLGWAGKLVLRYRLQPHFRHRLLAGTFTILALLCSAVFLGHRELTRRRQLFMEQKAQVSKQLKTMADRMQKLPWQCPDIAPEQLLKDARNALGKGRLAKAKAALEDLEQSLAQRAAKAIPKLEKPKTTRQHYENFSKLSYFIYSPLGKFLDKKQWEALRAETEASSDAIGGNQNSPHFGKPFTPYPNFDISWTPVTPGRLVSSIAPQKTIDIDYPFWVMNKPFTNSQYFNLTVDERMSKLPSDALASMLCWNDLLWVCDAMNYRLRNMGTLPEGYAVRIPTAAEWEYVMTRGWGAPTRGGNFSAAEFDSEKTGNIAEHSPELKLSRVANDACVFLQWNKKNNTCKQAEFGYDNHFHKYAYFRTVIAPTPEHYFQDQLFLKPKWGVATRPNGKVYAGITNRIAVMVRMGAKKLAEMMGGRLPEPESENDWHEIEKATEMPGGFPTHLGIVNKNGTWVYESNGKKVPIDGLPTASGNSIYLSGHQKTFSSASAQQYFPTFMVEWDNQQAFDKRGETFRKALEAPQVKNIHCQGRQLKLLPLVITGYLAESCADMVGMRGAVLDTQEKLDQVLPQLDVADSVVLLGCCHRGRKWYWNNGKTASLPYTPPNVYLADSITSPNIDSLCVKNGKLVRGYHVDYVLLESKEPVEEQKP